VLHDAQQVAEAHIDDVDALVGKVLQHLIGVYEHGILQA
jgi:hypothetical protein